MSNILTPEAIGIIVLAAGSSRRFGSDKRLARMPDGRTLLETTLASIPASYKHRLLVLQPGEQALADQFAEHWQPCFAENANTGMGYSLASGIRAAAHWPGAVIALADMPDISPQSYSAIQLALLEHAIVVPTCNGQQGNPVAFRQAYFEEIGNLAGDQGARKLLDAHADACYRLETGDTGILGDVDRPEMLNETDRQ